MAPRFIRAEFSGRLHTRTCVEGCGSEPVPQPRTHIELPQPSPPPSPSSPPPHRAHLAVFAPKGLAALEETHAVVEHARVDVQIHVRIRHKAAGIPC